MNGGPPPDDRLTATGFFGADFSAAGFARATSASFTTGRSPLSPRCRSSSASMADTHPASAERSRRRSLLASFSVSRRYPNISTVSMPRRSTRSWVDASAMTATTDAASVWARRRLISKRSFSPGIESGRSSSAAILVAQIAPWAVQSMHQFVSALVLVHRSRPGRFNPCTSWVGISFWCTDRALRGDNRVPVRLSKTL